MPIASEKSVRAYLDYLLVEMEISENKKFKKKFTDIINYYKEYYNIMEEYKNKENQILNKYKNKLKEK